MLSKLLMSICLGLSLPAAAGTNTKALAHRECFIGPLYGRFNIQESTRSIHISGLSTLQKSPLKFSYNDLGFNVQSDQCDNPMVWKVSDRTSYVLGRSDNSATDQVGLFKIDFNPSGKVSIAFHKIGELRIEQKYRGSAFLSVTPTLMLATRFDDSPLDSQSYGSYDYTRPNGLLIYTWDNKTAPNWLSQKPKTSQIRSRDLDVPEANVMLYASQILGESLKTPLLRHLDPFEWNILCTGPGDYCLGTLYGFACPTRFGDVDGEDDDEYELPFDGNRDCKQIRPFDMLLKSLAASPSSYVFEFPFELKEEIDAYLSGTYDEHSLTKRWLTYFSSKVDDSGVFQFGRDGIMEKIVKEFRPQKGSTISRESYLAQTISSIREKEVLFIKWVDTLTPKLDCKFCSKKIDVQKTANLVKQRATKSRLDFEQQIKTATSRLPANKNIFTDRFTYEVFYSHLKLPKQQLDDLSEGKVTLAGLLDSRRDEVMESID